MWTASVETMLQVICRFSFYYYAWMLCLISFCYYIVQYIFNQTCFFWIIISNTILMFMSTEFVCATLVWTSCVLHIKVLVACTQILSLGLAHTLVTSLLQNTFSCLLMSLSTFSINEINLSIFWFQKYRIYLRKLNKGPIVDEPQAWISDTTTNMNF
jgi:hypothetical protein